MASRNPSPDALALSEFSHLTGALLDVDQPKALGPAMTGTLRFDDEPPMVRIAAYAGASCETGRMAYRLSVGSEDGPKFTGRLFAHGTDSYTGFLAVSAAPLANAFASPVLALTGQRVGNRIEITGAPVRSI